jgi:tRNA G18 (ribose-2'-O)-methylase SpoU
VIYRLGADDHHLDPYRHVGEPQWLESRRLFVAESRFVVERLLAEPRYELESIAVTPTAFEALAPSLESVRCDVLICERHLLQDITGFNFHRGCIALAHRPEEREAATLLSGRRIVALEGVGNPDNVGGIFRTAAALGVDGIVLDRGCADPYYRKTIRTSMAATLQMPWARAGEWLEALQQFRAEGFTVVALSPATGNATIEEFSSRVKRHERLVVMFGAEGHGLTERSTDVAHERVRIPIEPGVDSLNIVVAAGIVLDRLRSL